MKSGYRYCRIFVLRRYKIHLGYWDVVARPKHLNGELGDISWTRVKIHEKRSDPVHSSKAKNK